MHEEAFETIRSWVGRKYSDLRCWDLLVEANALRGVTFPGTYVDALERRMLRTVTEPEPWDIVPITEHPTLPFITHAALVLPDGLFIQSIQEAGVVIQRLGDPLKFGRLIMVGDRPAFLRVRSEFCQ